MNKKSLSVLILIFLVFAGTFLWLNFIKPEEVVDVRPDVIPEKVISITTTSTETIIPTTTATTTVTTIANPASVNCTKQGGTLEIQTKEDGSQYGLCYFDDARACEEWAMLRGECPVGGVKTTGYETVAQKYCAWLGGRTLSVPDAVCTFNDNSTCLDSDLYLDACKKGDWPKEK